MASSFEAVWSKWRPTTDRATARATPFAASRCVTATCSSREGSPASGPGRLTRAFAVDRALDGTSFLTGPLWLEDGEPVPDRLVRRTRRIGVEYAGFWASRRYRFLIAGHPDVSGPKSLR